MTAAQTAKAQSKAPLADLQDDALQAERDAERQFAVIRGLRQAIEFQTPYIELAPEALKGSLHAQTRVREMEQRRADAVEARLISLITEAAELKNGEALSFDPLDSHLTAGIPDIELELLRVHAAYTHDVTAIIAIADYSLKHGKRFEHVVNLRPHQTTRRRN